MDVDENNDTFSKWASYLVEISQDPYKLQPLSRDKHDTLDPNLDALIEERLNCMKKLIDYEYAEVGSSRAIGKWKSDVNHVKIINHCDSSIQTLIPGNAKHIPPYQALFLLEIDRLEIIEDEVPWSVTKAYQTFLRNSADIAEYKNFRKVSLEKYFLSSFLSAEISSETYKENSMLMNSDFRSSEESADSTITLRQEYTKSPIGFKEIFENLKAAGPKTVTNRDDTVKALTRYGMSEDHYSGLYSTASYSKQDAAGILLQPVETLPPPIFHGG